MQILAVGHGKRLATALRLVASGFVERFFSTECLFGIRHCHGSLWMFWQWCFL